MGNYVLCYFLNLSCVSDFIEVFSIRHHDKYINQIVVNYHTSTGFCHMQKISSYLYPNRIELLADLPGFTVEFTNVYQRNIKIYNGIDNTIEFDIKNPDQKRIDLSTISNLSLNIMDSAGNGLPNSPYSILATSLKGIGVVTIPQEDLDTLTSQYLRYSVSAVKDNKDFMLYADAKFGAVGTIELIGDAMPIFRDERIYKDFVAEIDLHGNPIYHSSSIPVKFYEAVPTEVVSFDIHVTNFAGTVWLDATKHDTITVESFKIAGKPFGSWTNRPIDGLYTGVIPYATTIPVGEYSYFRVSYQATSLTGIGATFDIRRLNDSYYVTIRNSGTSYMIGSLIKVLGSQLAGADGVNDVIIVVTGVEGMGSTYSMGSIAGISWSGIAIPGDSTDVVSGINYSGILDSVTVM